MDEELVRGDGKGRQMTVMELWNILAQYPGDHKVLFETECCSTAPSGEVKIYERSNGDKVLWFSKDWDN